MTPSLSLLRERYPIRLEAIDGVEWAYIDTLGRGRCLVLLPGGLGTCEIFFKQLLALGEALRLVAVTYPAESDPVRLATGLARFLERQGISTTSVLGSSFGGYWAQFFASRLPDRVEHLFLGNTFVDARPLHGNPLFDPVRIGAADAGAVMAQWREVVRQRPGGELKDVLHELLGLQGATCLRARMAGVAHAIPSDSEQFPDARVTLIQCPDDPIIAPAMRERLRAKYPGAEHHALAGGHYPHVVNPAAYNAVIAARLSDAAVYLKEETNETALE